MIDALLYAVRDALRNVNDGITNNALKLAYTTCEIREAGEPPPRCGDYFISVHQGTSTSDSDNCLDEYFGFSVTLTMRLSNVPLDRVGDQLLARKTAREKGFNARAMQLRAFLHMNWGILQDANNYILQMDEGLPEFLMQPNASTSDQLIGGVFVPGQIINGVVYGFCEPARYRGMEVPVLVGPEWFGADNPGATDVGLKSELRFEDARRFQPIATFE